MSKVTDRTYLRERQYRNADNLNARMALHARFRTNPYGWPRWVFDQFDLPASCCLLELGCGAGTLWRENLDRIPPGWEILLSDFSPGMVQEAQSQLESGPHPFAFEVCDAQSLPLPDRSLDAVIANHMLYHVPDRAAAFAEITRVLKPGGRLYAATNGRDHLRELNELQQRLGIPDAISTHAQGFTLEEGATQLAPWFADVTLRHYEDELRVTEAEPLAAYILSTAAGLRLPEAQKTDLRHRIALELEREGSLRIRKATGLFIASTPVRTDDIGVLAP